MSLNKELALKPNPDLVKERKNSDVDYTKLRDFLGYLLFGTNERHKFMINMREKILNEIEPVNYNFHNLNREGRFDFNYRKSIEVLLFLEKNTITDQNERNFLTEAILASGSKVFGLHDSMVRKSFDLWANEEQKRYWLPKLQNYSVMVTYAQTELGHGTFVRGLETTATYDKTTDEFILNSPTITSYKYWPGSLGVTCNHAIVMARLIVNNVDEGIHAFIVQLRSTENHKAIPNIEIGDIGQKFGFNSQDNGYLAFHNVRIPRSHMLMNFAQVTKDGKFKRFGNELLMYASMLLMRTFLVRAAAVLLSLSLTISIRYSCVRHQTANDKGVEPQILDYQTQQYRLFPGLSICYAMYFTSFKFRDIVNTVLQQSNGLKNVTKETLAQLHVMSSALKAYSYDNCLKYSQISRLCCGGHGYSESSGLPHIIFEAHAGCTVEGENTVLYLQAARHLVKCAKLNLSPHFEFNNKKQLIQSALYKKYQSFIEAYHQLYEKVIADVMDQMTSLLSSNLSEQEAWNNSSVNLVQLAKIYAHVFIIWSNLDYIQLYNNYDDSVDTTKQGLIDLFELNLIYGMIDVYAADFLKYKIVDHSQITNYQARLFQLLQKIRKNAVVFVDGFDWLDSNLCSTLGAYDGNVYEGLLNYARNSEMNKNQGFDQFEKYLKPFIKRYNSKL